MAIGSILLALLALGFLIFIHELGHYFVALRVGMRVEAFSIGFGKPIISWVRNGVLWQLGWLPFGGYVKIAGMEKEGNLEPYQIPDGFFGKSPWARIKVAFMGPLVNILFGFLCFAVIWTMGGRIKNFSEYTQLIGSVKASSALHEEGIGPGAEIVSLGGHHYSGFYDLRYADVLKDRDPEMRVRPLGSSISKNVSYTAGDVTAPAMQLIIPSSSNDNSPFLPTSDLKDSGIEEGDQIVWADGAKIFSLPQLMQLVNDGRALLTVQRADEIFFTRVPVLSIEDIRLTEREQELLDEWRDRAEIEGRTKAQRFIPYTVNGSGVVEGESLYYNNDAVETTYQPEDVEPLASGDRILAVDGQSVVNGTEMFKALQKKRVAMIVYRPQEMRQAQLWTKADHTLQEIMTKPQLDTLIDKLKHSSTKSSDGQYHVLRPVEPKAREELYSDPELKEVLDAQIAAREAQIAKIKDPTEREEMQHLLDEDLRSKKLGVALTDVQVIYNPGPFSLFGDIVIEMRRALGALFGMKMSPRELAGPIGIVTVLSHGWSVGLMEALYWVGMISVNLALFNLLPIPALDGGHICFAIWEKIAGKPLKAKTMQRLVLPFVIFLIAMILFITFNDILRLLRNLL